MNQEPIPNTDLDAIEARAQAATPGPWRELAEPYSKAMKAYRKSRGRWYHGKESDSLPVTLLASATCSARGGLQVVGHFEI